jgi:hypothetical protein
MRITNTLILLICKCKMIASISSGVRKTNKVTSNGNHKTFVFNWSLHKVGLSCKDLPFIARKWVTPLLYFCKRQSNRTNCPLPAPPGDRLLRRGLYITWSSTLNNSSSLLFCIKRCISTSIQCCCMKFGAFSISNANTSIA